MTEGPLAKAGAPSSKRRFWIRIAIITILAVLIVPVVLAGALYAGDYGVEADVTETSCDVIPPLVAVKTRAFSILHQQEIPEQSCAIVRPGNFVIYHVRSQHTILYEKEGGKCLYDSEKGHLCGIPAGPLIF